MTDAEIVGLLRELAPQVLGALVRRFGHFDTAEDAVQEALLAATTQWPEQGVPDNPKAWLIQVGYHKLTDLLRSEQARRKREEQQVQYSEAPPVPDEDDTLVLLFMCCHPALTPPSQIALTLRAVGGLTTEEIAKAFLVPDSTMGQRISRAKQKIKASGEPFRLPHNQVERLKAVQHVLYLIFNEGYAATSGDHTLRTDLTREAIRLTRELLKRMPESGEVQGLLALMLLTDARSAARTGPDGELIPLAEQDRTRWNHTMIEEGIALVEKALSTSTGPYQVQAAIAALHDEAKAAEDTDWPQILALYRLLERFGDNPMVRLNHAVAAAMVHGPQAGLDMLSPLEDQLPEHHRVEAVRAHLLEMTGDRNAAREAYLSAARRTLSVPEQRYLRNRAAEL